MSIFSIIGKDNNNYSHLSIQKIFEILFLWSMKNQRFHVLQVMNIDAKTVTYWFSVFRNICKDYFELRKPMGSGLKTIIEIDESLLRGKRKNHKGRYLNYDVWNADPNAEYFLPEELLDEEISNLNESVDQYHNRIDGPWVLGIIECSVNENGKRKLNEARYFVVEKRNKETLIPIIQREVEQNSTIYTDEWRAYSTLDEIGYTHKTVNDSQFYVSQDGSHTNTVEVTWHHLKTKLLRKMFGVPNHLLSSYLIEESVRSKYSNGFEFFNKFIEILPKILYDN